MVLAPVLRLEPRQVDVHRATALPMPVEPLHVIEQQVLLACRVVLTHPLGSPPRRPCGRTADRGGRPAPMPGGLSAFLFYKCGGRSRKVPMRGRRAAATRR